MDFQQPVGINFGDCLKGPHNLPAQVSGHDYLNFLQTHLSVLVDVSFNACLLMSVLHHITLIK
jgi:hypothetical protein